MTTTKTPGNARRTALIKLIHVARRELGQKSGLDDLAYRDILRIVGKSESLAAMTVPNMELVLAHMKSKGFKVRPKAGDRPQVINPDASKVRALWLFLHALGEVRDPSERALAAYVKRIAKVDALQWTNGNQTEALIETLKKWAMRYLPGQVREMAQTLSEAIKTGSVTLSDEELTGLRSTVGLAQTRQTFDPMQTAWDALKTALDKREKP